MSLVFSVEIHLNQISFKKVGVVLPSISVSIAKNDPKVLWTSESKVNDTQSITIDRAYQIMVTVDVFDAINSWKFGINLTMDKDQVPLGTCTFEFKPLIASALATCHSSPTISSQGAIRDFQKDVIAVISFDARVIYYPGSEHKQMVEIFLVRPLEKEPPHDTYYKPHLQNSSSIQRSQSNSSVLRNNASSSSISVSISNSETDSDLLGSHNSYKNASEATRIQREQASKENLKTQIASAKKESLKPQQTNVSRYNSTINDDDDNNNTNSYTKSTNTTTVYTTSHISTNNPNNSMTRHSSTNNVTSHTSTNEASSNFTSSKKKMTDSPHVQISTNSALNSISKVISTENHSSTIDDDFFDDYDED